MQQTSTHSRTTTGEVEGEASAQEQEAGRRGERRTQQKQTETRSERQDQPAANAHDKEAW